MSSVQCLSSSHPSWPLGPVGTIATCLGVAVAIIGTLGYLGIFKAGLLMTGLLMGGGGLGALSGVTMLLIAACSKRSQGGGGDNNQEVEHLRNEVQVLRGQLKELGSEATHPSIQTRPNSIECNLQESDVDQEDEL